MAIMTNPERARLAATMSSAADAMRDSVHAVNQGDRDKIKGYIREVKRLLDHAEEVMTAFETRDEIEGKLTPKIDW